MLQATRNGYATGGSAKIQK